MQVSALLALVWPLRMLLAQMGSTVGITIAPVASVVTQVTSHVRKPPARSAQAIPGSTSAIRNVAPLVGSCVKMEDIPFAPKAMGGPTSAVTNVA